MNSNGSIYRKHTMRHYFYVYMDIHQIQRHVFAHHVTVIYVYIWTYIRFRDISLHIMWQLSMCIYGHTSDSETFLCTPCDSYLCVYMDIHQIQKHCLAHHVTFIFVDISTSDSETFLCVYMDKHFLRLSFLFRFMWNYCVLLMYIPCPLHIP